MDGITDRCGQCGLKFLSALHLCLHYTYSAACVEYAKDVSAFELIETGYGEPLMVIPETLYLHIADGAKNKWRVRGLNDSGFDCELFRSIHREESQAWKDSICTPQGCM